MDEHVADDLRAAIRQYERYRTAHIEATHAARAAEAIWKSSERGLYKLLDELAGNTGDTVWFLDNVVYSLDQECGDVTRIPVLTVDLSEAAHDATEETRR